MLKKRIIPKLQMIVSERFSPERLVLVNTRQFQQMVLVGDPVSQARILESQMSDELILLDIRPTQASRKAISKVLNTIADEIFMPITIGGGIRSLTDVEFFLQNGADKVSINTQALAEPELITKIADRYGNQCVVVSIDAKCDVDGNWHVFSFGGQQVTNWQPIDWAIEVERRGAGEILLTSINADGTSQGLAIELCQKMTKKVNIPIILGGGCGNAQHFIDAFVIGQAHAVTAGTFFSQRDQNQMQIRSIIKNHGIPVRILT